jgi:hypothetical protein
MKKKIKYTDEPIQLGKTVKDFLPSPEELVMQDKNIRVTMKFNTFLNKKREHGPGTREPGQPMMSGATFL